MLCGPCAVELARKIIDSAASTFHECTVCHAAYSDTEPHAKSPRIPLGICWVCAHLYQSAQEPSKCPLFC
jgi:rubredoxin